MKYVHILSITTLLMEHCTKRRDRYTHHLVSMVHTVLNIYLFIILCIVAGQSDV